MQALATLVVAILESMFFVISGYLITMIIIRETEIGTFRLVRFYERRARRLLPAQFLVIFTCIPLSWLFLPADLYMSFSQAFLLQPYLD